MGFLNTNSMPRLVEKLADGDNIKITGNSKGNRVGTVIKKIVEKADDVTKAIEQEVVNNSYSFKVGTGNVDVSTDVEDGFGEVGIKGVTLQNCYPPLTTSNFSPLNGTITSDGYVSMQGDGANWKNAWIDINKCLIKPNTTYTLVCYVLENTLVEGLYLTTASNQCVFRATNKVPAKTTGLLCYIATTIGDFTSVPNGLRSYLSNTETGKIVFKVMVLEGDHTNNPNLPSYFEGIQGVGDKSKNLLNPNSFKSSNGISMIENQVINIDVPTDGGQRTIFEGLNLPAGTYRVTTEVLEGEYTGGNLIFYDSNGKKFTENRLIGSYTINATNNNINKLLIWAVKGICKIRIQLEKGSSETPYEPYHDGHKIEILSNGKNIINLKDMPTGSLGDTGKVVMSPTSNYKVTPNFIKIEPTRKFCFYYEYDENDTSTPNHNMIAYYDKNFSYIGATYDWSTKGIVTTPPTEAHYLRLRVRKEAIKLSLIFESSIVYEPYVSDKTQILLDEPLMRLPNGVCDEITRDGKLIRRVGKIVFDGTENWSPYNINGNTTHFAISIPYIDKFNGGLISHIEHNNNKFMCDKALVTQTRKANLTSICSFYYGPENRYFMFNLPCSSLESAKNWLIENKPILYFPLPTPTIIELPAPYLRIFKDGHLTFNTLVAPESNHVVQLNKSAQIERSIREVQGLDSRVGKLESFYDDMMLETSHKLNLLTYDFEYTKESEDI